MADLYVRSRPTLPTLYQQVEERIQNLNYESSVSQIPLRALNPDQETSTPTDIEQVQREDRVKRQNNLRLQARDTLLRQEGEPKDIITNVQNTLKEVENVKPRTLGEIYKSQRYGQAQSDIDKVLDQNLLYENDRLESANTLGYNPEVKSFDEVLDDRKPDYLDELKDLATYLPKDSVVRQGIESLSDERKGLDFLQTLDDADILQSTLFRRLAAPAFEKVGLPKDASFREVIEFLSFVPENKDATIDIENMVNVIFSKDDMKTRLNRLKQWDTEYRAKYGNEGYWQLGAFMAKEGIVDAASLALALKSNTMKKLLLAKPSANIWKRMVKALGRATVMGIGGTGVQYSMDQYLGFETDTTEELGLRIGGAFVGEGIARAISSGARGLKGLGARLINKGDNLVNATGEPLTAVTDDILDSVKDAAIGKTTTKSMYKGLTEAAQETGITEDLVRANQQIAETLRADSLGIEGRLNHFFDLTPVEKQHAAFTGDLTVKEEISLRGVGNRLIGEDITKQQDVEDTLTWFFDHTNKTVQRRPGRIKGEGGWFRLKETFFEPDNFIGAPAKDFRDTIFQDGRFTQALQEAEKVAFKGVSKKIYNKILDLRDEAAEIATKQDGFFVTPEWLTQKGLSTKEIDSYYAYSKLVDFGVILHESLRLQSIREQGLKLFNDQVVKVIRQIDDSHVLIKSADSAGDIHQKAKVSDLQEITRVTGYLENFVSRRPDNARFFVGVYDKNTGQSKAPFAARGETDARARVAKLEKEADNNKVVWYWKNNTREKNTHFGITRASSDILNGMDDDAIDSLLDALKKADITDIDRESIILGLDTAHYGGIADKKVGGKRAATKLLEAALDVPEGTTFKYKIPERAMAQYFMEVGATQGREFRSEITKQFMKDFSEVLDPALPWDQPIKQRLGFADVSQRARTAQDYIKRNIFQRTALEEAIDNSISSLAEGFRKSNSPRARAFIRAVENNKIFGDLLIGTRDVTSFARTWTSATVFLGNVASWFTQTAPSIAMIAGAKILTNPQALIKGWTKYLYSMAVKASGSKHKLNKEWVKSLQALERSGVLSRQQVNDFANRAYNGSPYADAAMATVSGGESVNKGNVWMVIREDLISQVKKGKLKDFNGNTLTEKDIDSDLFIQLVTEKASPLFLDTTRAGRLRITSSAGSLILHFMEPLIKTSTLIFNKNLTLTERIGAASGLFAFYGAGAIPLAASLVALGDEVGELITGGDTFEEQKIVSAAADNIAKDLIDLVGDLAGATSEQKKWFRKVVKEGGVKTLTGGEVDLYHKMAMGLFVKETIENFSGDGLLSIPVVSVMTRAAENSSNIIEFFSQMYAAHVSDNPEDQKAEEIRQLTGNILDSTGNIFPGIGKIVDVINNDPRTRELFKPQQAELGDTGFITRSGKRIHTKEPISDYERMLIFFGITPQEVSKNYTILEGQFDRVQRLKELEQTWLDKYKNATTRDQKLKVMKQGSKEMKLAEKALMATFQGALLNFVGRSDDKANYKFGTATRRLQSRMRRIDEERMLGNYTVSQGEEDE